jgi:hypothetical protein
VVTPEWRRFTAALEEALATLPLGVLIIDVRSRPGGFVQFAHNGDHIRAEASGGADAFGAPLLSGAQRTALAAAGWQAPPEGAQLNCWWRLDWPAWSAGNRRLAEMSVRALREAYGAESPAALAYEAWTDGATKRVEFDLGIGR